ITHLLSTASRPRLVRHQHLAFFSSFIYIYYFLHKASLISTNTFSNSSYRRRHRATPLMPNGIETRQPLSDLYNISKYPEDLSRRCQPHRPTPRRLLAGLPTSPSSITASITIADALARFSLGE
ncbi:hypothetical protein K443DRAFT_632146, partial [Laccaria amethystina LaAM-08-1]